MHNINTGMIDLNSSELIRLMSIFFSSEILNMCCIWTVYFSFVDSFLLLLGMLDVSNCV